MKYSRPLRDSFPTTVQKCFAKRQDAVCTDISGRSSASTSAGKRTAATSSSNKQRLVSGMPCAGTASGALSGTDSFRYDPSPWRPDPSQTLLLLQEHVHQPRRGRLPTRRSGVFNGISIAVLHHAHGFRLTFRSSTMITRRESPLLAESMFLSRLVASGETRNS